ncbi:GNAT family N-acetyltransferase [Ammoniphilus sp. CFH 90114]|uniref:GNAT family N-acetyltransferase n=1 Tax=Ammoniphilus sp. CFH 90114 TaxID=2493665 RepID=UPI00100E833D|nr:GNAT family N-acetyltransferase [Ammoniphilus sp. CFH 90114]RXT15398.1 GNAT family N-acetyltransferase [Ammoniphilus sp. CFH 90114]
MSVTIRKAESKDVSSLLILMNSYIVDFYKREKPNQEDLTRLVMNLLDNPSAGIQFVVEEKEEIIGFATLYYTFSTLQVKRAAILNDLFIHERMRGKKIGEKLFEKCVEYIREQNFAYMTWETAHDNLAAQALYDKMGGKRSEWLSYSIS